MLQFLESGQALYVLAGICLLGIFTRVMTKNIYKRMIKESANMASTKNKSLRELKQRTENAYRMNQGLQDRGAWLEHQLCELRFRGMTLAGWANLSLQLTWLCLLTGGTAAFFSYWYRLDTFYVVMYGGGSVLMAMLTMLFDNGAAGGRRELLAAILQDYLENVLCPRLERNLSEDNAADSSRSKVRSFTRLKERGNPQERKVSVMDGGQAGQTELQGQKEGAATQEEHTKQEERAGQAENAGQDGRTEYRGARTAAGGGRRNGRGGRKESAPASEADSDPRSKIRDVDYLKRSLEQIAASREKGKDGDESWLKELGPDEVQLIGDILKEYLV